MSHYKPRIALHILLFGTICTILGFSDTVSAQALSGGLRVPANNGSFVSATVRLAGPGLTPFTADKQLILIKALAATLTNPPVLAVDISVDQVLGVFNNRRRQLLNITGSPSDPGAYADEADALVLIDAHSHIAAVAIAAELQPLFNGTAQVALSNGGLSKTGATLISTAVIVPSCTTAPTYYGALTGKECPKPKSTSTSKGTGKGKKFFVQLAIVLGVALLAILFATSCFICDRRRRRRQAAEVTAHVRDMIPPAPTATWRGSQK